MIENYSLAVITCLYFVFSHGPCGFNFDRAHAEAANQPLRPQAIYSVDPNSMHGKAELSGLGLRHTYTLDPKAVDPKMFPAPARRENCRPITTKKTIRAMRLRPRKVLCSNCKQCIHDTKVKGQGGPSTRSTANITANVTANVTANNPATTISNKTSNANGVINGETQLLSSKRKPEIDRDKGPQRKSRRLDKSDPAKTVPVLKISLGSAREGGTVLKIPTREPKSEEEENENQLANNYTNTLMTHHQYRKMRKALKKARLKEKAALTDGSVMFGDNGRHKRKHNKHKRKHKHKNVEECQDGIVSISKDIGSSHEASDDTLVPVCADSSQQHTDSDPEHKIDRAEKYAISNAGEFTTIKKSIVRLTKLSLPDDHAAAAPADTLSPGTPPLFAVADDITDHVDEPDSTEVDRPPSPLYDEPLTPTLTPYQVQVSDISDADDTADDDASFTSAPSGNGSNTLYTCPPPPPAPSLYAAPVSSLSPMHPLLMRIHTNNLVKCQLDDGRVMSCGDIIWGKIQGFPWWPGRICSITQSVKDSGGVIAHTATVSWFGSSTMSYMDCHDLYPFLDNYKLRYNKKKKGMYKLAIKQATLEAKALMGEAALDPGKSPLFEVDTSDNGGEDDDSCDGYESLQELDDNDSSLDKENVSEPPPQLHLEGFEHIKLHENRASAINSGGGGGGGGGSVRKNDGYGDDQLNNINNLDTFNMEIAEDLNVEVLED